MLKQDVPLRTGWFGYRKLDVENCIAHIRAAYAAELRLARQTQQGMEETMAQLRQENKALRQRFAQQAAAQAAASVRAEDSDKLQQLIRKLEAAHAEIRRYQTRLFACERQMIALRRENADLEAACEQAREELQMAVARAEKAEQQAAQRPACPEVPVQACLRESDILVRYGGDEFLLLMPQLRPEGLPLVMDRIQEAVRQARVESHPEIRLSISVGGVCGVHPLREAIRQADDRMYQNKARNKK